MNKWFLEFITCAFINVWNIKNNNNEHLAILNYNSITLIHQTLPQLLQATVWREPPETLQHNTAHILWESSSSLPILLCSQLLFKKTIILTLQLIPQWFTDWSIGRCQENKLITSLATITKTQPFFLQTWFVFCWYSEISI